MKPAVLYACLFVYVAVIFSMKNDCQMLQNNALTFDNQCKKMKNLIAAKVKNDQFASHMYNNLSMRNWYLKKALAEKIEQSFLKGYYILHDQNKSIHTLCDDLVSSYAKYSNDHSNQENMDLKWQELLKEMNGIIVKYFFL